MVWQNATAVAANSVKTLETRRCSEKPEQNEKRRGKPSEGKRLTPATAKTREKQHGAG